MTMMTAIDRRVIGDGRRDETTSVVRKAPTATVSDATGTASARVARMTGGVTPGFATRGDGNRRPGAMLMMRIEDVDPRQAPVRRVVPFPQADDRQDRPPVAREIAWPERRARVAIWTSGLLGWNVRSPSCGVKSRYYNNRHRVPATVDPHHPWRPAERVECRADRKEWIGQVRGDRVQMVRLREAREGADRGLCLRSNVDHGLMVPA